MHKYFRVLVLVFTIWVSEFKIVWIGWEITIYKWELLFTSHCAWVASAIQDKWEGLTLVFIGVVVMGYELLQATLKASLQPSLLLLACMYSSHIYNLGHAFEFTITTTSATRIP